MSDDRIYIGTLSGTSIDQIDTVAVCFHDDKFTIHAAQPYPIPSEIRTAILHAQKQPVAIQQIAELDARLGLLFATACTQLIKQAQLDHKQIGAIGLHGQTVVHQASVEPTFSVQLANPNLVVAKTHCPVVADFRRMDMALGGQGAPLACAFHRAFFSDPKETRAIVNVGGIANVTVLVPGQRLCGFDCGPGNILLDRWIDCHLNQAYDDAGQWAAGAQVDKALLATLLNDDLLVNPQHPSLCTSYFSIDWLERKIATHTIKHKDPARVVQSTLVELTAICINKAIQTYSPQNVFLCGGGTRNTYLLERIQAHCKATVNTSQALGIDPQLVESLTFAWLAQQRINHQTIAIHEVTRAQGDTLLGCVYEPG